MEQFIPRTQTVNGKKEIFDIIRKKFVALTPEELVRQQLLHYLTTVKKFPEGLLQVEMSIMQSRYTLRADVVAYDRYLKPLLIAECKAPKIKITQETCEQIARYNLILRVPYLLITNGWEHFFFRFDSEKSTYVLAAEMANYGDLIAMAKNLKKIRIFANYKT
jgi:type I site-specific restriction endonuclease